MSATGHQLRRRVTGANRVMALLGENPDFAELYERFKLGPVSSKDALFDILQSRSDVEGIAAHIEMEPVRQTHTQKGTQTDEAALAAAAQAKAEKEAAAAAKKAEKDAEKAAKAAAKEAEKQAKADAQKAAKGKPPAKQAKGGDAAKGE